LRIVFTARATDDIENVVSYGIQEWGEEQARSYLDGMLQSIQQLADHPDLGVACDEIRPGWRVLTIQQHLAFFHTFGESVVILRVVHHRMDRRRFSGS